MAHGEVPVALTIAGSDSSAGAGAQADLKTFAACGVYGLNALTCVVAETPGKVARISAVTAEMVAQQIDVLFDSFPIAAIKTGLLFSREIVETVAQKIADRARQIPLVVDPVMIATSGDTLLEADAIAAYEQKLFPLAALVTPNLDEAARLLNRAISDKDSMRAGGREFAKKYQVPFLLKGGHLTGDHAVDLLFQGDEVVEFSAPFQRGVATHGTGCTYSAAITAGLASGLSLAESIGRAKEYVTRTIAQHFHWRTKNGSVLHALNHSPNESET